MVWVVPRFVEVYEGIDGAEIPGITVFVMSVSAFLQKNYIYLIWTVRFTVKTIYSTALLNC